MQNPPSGRTGGDPASALLEKLAGKAVVQAICTAAHLGLAEALATPADVETLAERLRCEPAALQRLLHILVSEAIVEEARDGTFRLTPMGRLLGEDALGPFVEFVGSPSQWNAWSELRHAVRTGTSAFERVHGRPLYEHLAATPADAALYDRAVDAFTVEQARALAADPALDHLASVVDLGGGRGSFLLELLRRRPTLRGVLFDRPHVLADAPERFADQGVCDRCTFAYGDFFTEIPRGHDGYVLKHVLHNWDDERASAILQGCARAMNPRGVVLVVDALLLPSGRSDLTRCLDLEMLVLTGSGKERSKPQMRRLFASAGLRLVATRWLAMGAALFVGARSQDADPPPE